MERLTSRLACVALAACCVVSLGARAAAASSRGDSLYEDAAEASAAYGTVSAVESGGGVAADAPRGSGAVIGGVLGAVIGRQMADGSRGKNIAAAVGAGVGALIGHEIEKNVRRDRGGVRVTVRLDDGRTRRFDVKDSDGLRVGDRVRIDGDRLYRLS